MDSGGSPKSEKPKKSSSKKSLFRKNSKTKKDEQSDNETKEDQPTNNTSNNKSKDTSKDISQDISKDISKDKSKDKSNSNSKKKRPSSPIKDEAAKKLEWKFAQRSDVDELVGRGIVGSEYSDVLKGNKDIKDAELEHEKYEKKTKDKINKVFEMDLRPSADDIEDRGIAPSGSLAGAKKSGHEYKGDIALTDAKNEKKIAKEKLAAKFGQRNGT